MFNKLRDLLFSDKSTLSPQVKAKAAYYVLISQGKAIVQDIVENSPDEFLESKAYRIFLANEVGVVMCLNSAREGFNRFFENSQESDLFSSTLLYLFNNHLQMPLDVFNLYVELGQKHEDPDKIFMHLFAGRISAFLENDIESLTNKEKAWMYSWQPDALVYAEIYTKIFEMICEILNSYAGKSANRKKILQMAAFLDEDLRLISEA